MEIPFVHVEEDSSDSCEDRISDVAVFPRHGPRLDAALEPVPHDHVVAFAQLLNKVVQMLEIITVVGVAHDAKAAARLGDCAVQRGAVAADGDIDHAGAETGSYLLRTVGGA